MMDQIIDYDYVDLQHCSECGDEIKLEKVSKREVEAKALQLERNGWQCDRCEEGSTPFAKQAEHHIYQWLGPIEFEEKVATVVEPQNASYAVVTLKDRRSAKVFRRGESPRELWDETRYVLERHFPDLKMDPSPAQLRRANA